MGDTKMTTSTAYVFNETNNTTFIRTANSIAKSGIFFDKPAVKSLNIMEHFFNLSRQCLGKDFQFLQDAPSTRLYISDVFDKKSLRFFEDINGEIILDIEHALLFFYWLKAQNHPQLQYALGIVYFIAGHQLDDEFAQISKVAPKNRIEPLFELSPTLFRWKRCNFVLRKYMLALTKPEGYTTFSYEMPNVNQIAYLLFKGMDIGSARNQLENAQGGLFYTYLPRDVENMLLPSILGGEFAFPCMDGYYAQTLISDFKAISSDVAVSQVYNVYTQNVKPILVDIMGRMLLGITEEINSNQAVGTSDVEFYHISPSRLGIKVADGFSISNVLPNLHPHFTEVKPFMHFDLLSGEHLY